jgi:hypothetical protein
MSERFFLGKIMGHALDANLRYVALATRVASSALGSALTTSSATPALFSASAGSEKNKLLAASSQARAARPAILLEGKAGTKATALFVLENHLPHEVSAHIEITPMVTPSGRKLRSALHFDSRELVLASGQKVVARVSAPISRNLIAGEQYMGEIRVQGIPGASIPLILCRAADPKPVRASRRLTAGASATADRTAKTSRPRRGTTKSASRA